jgi:hypothetical protein
MSALGDADRSAPKRNEEDGNVFTTTHSSQRRYSLGRCWRLRPASDGPSRSARARCDPPILGTCSGNEANCWVVDVDAQQAAQSLAPMETSL